MLRGMAKVFVLCGLFLVFATTAVKADSLILANGKTVTGSFVYDATTNTVVSFNFTSNDSLNSTTTVWNSADAVSQGANAFLSTNPGGDEVISLFEAQSADSQTLDELTLVFSCGGVANCLTQAVDGDSYALTTGTGCPTCNISQVALNAPADLVDNQIVNPAFITIVDPPSPTDSIFTMTVSSVSTGAVYNGSFPGSTGGGGNTNVPEPSSLLLLCCGIAGLLFVKFIGTKRINNLVTAPQF
jgi:hypothetical protein